MNAIILKALPTRRLWLAFVLLLGGTLPVLAKAAAVKTVSADPVSAGPLEPGDQATPAPVPPAPPTLTSSQTSVQLPSYYVTVSGSVAEEGNVTLYGNYDCSGAPQGSGSSSSGLFSIQVPMPTDTLGFSATVTSNQTGLTSNCSTSVPDGPSLMPPLEAVVPPVESLPSTCSSIGRSEGGNPLAEPEFIGITQQLGFSACCRASMEVNRGIYLAALSLCGGALPFLEGPLQCNLANRVVCANRAALQYNAYDTNAAYNCSQYSGLNPAPLKCSSPDAPIVPGYGFQYFRSAPCP